MDSVLEIECGFNNDHRNIRFVIYFPYLLSSSNPGPFLTYSCIPKYLPRKKRYNPIHLFVTGRCPQRFFYSQRLPSLMRKQTYKISERILNLFLEERNLVDLIAELKEEKQIYPISIIKI